MIKIATAFKKIGKDKRGFTLVELMAVFAVLAIIAAIAVPRFTGTINTAKKNADKASAQIIARAAEQKWIDDNEASKNDPADGYKASDLEPDYLKEVPTPQNSDETDWYAELNNKGECIGVYYGESASGDNLLTDTD
jgi:type IV pilus assembly protein PilA